MTEEQLVTPSASDHETFSNKFNLHVFVRSISFAAPLALFPFLLFVFFRFQFAVAFVSLLPPLKSKF